MISSPFSPAPAVKQSYQHEKVRGQHGFLNSGRGIPLWPLLFSLPKSDRSGYMDLGQLRTRREEGLGYILHQLSNGEKPGFTKSLPSPNCKSRLSGRGKVVEMPWSH